MYLSIVYDSIQFDVIEKTSLSEGISKYEGHDNLACSISTLP